MAAPTPGVYLAEERDTSHSLVPVKALARQISAFCACGLS